MEHLKEPHARAGENAVVLAGIGYVYSQFSNLGANDRDYVALAEEHARRALKLDPENPEAHMVLGYLYLEGMGDIDRGLHHLGRSLDVKPDDTHTLLWWILGLRLDGRNEEMEVSYRGSPEGSSESFFYAHALATVGREDEALAIQRSEFAPDTQGQFAPVARLLRAALEGDPKAMEAALTPEFRDKLSRDIGMGVYTNGIHALAGLRDATNVGLRVQRPRGFR